ncbi:hypothetical protein BV25DRAFT_1828380 [Artomyces pyxidatus]|uniref:Uncharacterized protein n=1 Tax=Artomyces pyxidatus TaxID=48021 RepID=A0ACB8SU38_9AGAM|nr:hypothetical protein BV25DRAFT_1828380 [Artomyces pyxidatus]
MQDLLRPVSKRTYTPFVHNPTPWGPLLNMELRLMERGSRRLAKYMPLVSSVPSSILPVIPSPYTVPSPLNAMPNMSGPPYEPQSDTTPTEANGAGTAPGAHAITAPQDPMGPISNTLFEGDSTLEIVHGKRKSPCSTGKENTNFDAETPVEKRPRIETPEVMPGSMTALLMGSSDSLDLSLLPGMGGQVPNWLDGGFGGAAK